MIPKQYRLRFDRDYPFISSVDCATAFLGDVIIASYVRLSDGTGWKYRVDGIHTKWVTKGYGKVSSEAAARRAINRAWKAWLQQAGLIS